MVFNKKNLISAIFLVFMATNSAFAAPSLSQTSVTIGLGQTITVSSQGNSTGVYPATNSDSSVALVQARENQLSIRGNKIGATTVFICYVGTAADCASLNITVQAGTAADTSSNTSSNTTTNTSSGGQVTFGLNNPTVVVGQAISVSLSGGASYFISSNPNPNIIQSAINGSSLSITGVSAGSASLTVCVSTGGCNTLSVTVAGSVAAAVATPAVTAPIITNVSDPASLLASIQAMQSQLVQLLAQIQSMATSLTQLALRVGASPVSVSQTASISSALTTNKYVFTKFLSEGDNGEEVTALQKALTQKGVYSGPITGQYGPLTEAAVKKFQSQNGIDPAGYVGPSTRAALNR